MRASKNDDASLGSLGRAPGVIDRVMLDHPDYPECVRIGHDGGSWSISFEKFPDRDQRKT